MTNASPRFPRQNFILILTLGILNALTPFTIDMYLPSFSVIARDLGRPVSEMALTVSIYFIGFALGQIFYGPLLDRFGRKRPLYAGLFIYVVASLGCMTARSMEALLFFRFLSAIGGCAASVGATAMVRDFFPPKDAVKIFAMLMLVLSASPLLAPSVGSIVVAFAHWRIIFGILMLLGCMNMVLVYALPKGQAPDRSVSLRPFSVFMGFIELLKVRQFTTYTLAGALSFTGLFVYVAGSPAIFLEGFGVSAQVYGGIFAFLAVGVIGGGQLNHFLVSRFHGKTIFRTALIVEMMFGLGFLATEYFGLNGLASTIGFLFFILLCAGISSPNAAALALEPFSKNIGSASALLGFIQLGIGATTSAVVGLLKAEGSLPMALVISMATALGVLILWFSSRWE